MLGAFIRRGAPLLVAGALGAGIAVGVAAAFDDDGGGTTTIIQQAANPTAAASQPHPAAFTSGQKGLSIEQIYDRYGPGVVLITATSKSQTQETPFGPQGGGTQQALGSGFVIDKAGHIVTNYHVVQGAQEVRVKFSQGSGDQGVPAKVVGADASSDIAVLEVNMPASALTPIPLGDSDDVQVGDPVVAIGNPFGLDRTVTSGIVSALQREITSPNGFQIEHVIQTDAAINHGNSGGPLLNAEGQVIGVNSQIQSGGVDGNVGIGFAVPIDTVKDVASQLIATGKVERAYVGIEMETITPAAAQSFRLATDKGVIIATVRPGSPAAEAGIKGGHTSAVLNGQSWVLGGDVIVKADGQAVTSADQLRELVLGKKPGDTLSLQINRDGQTLDLTVKLGRQPNTPTG